MRRKKNQHVFVKEEIKSNCDAPNCITKFNSCLFSSILQIILSYINWRWTLSGEGRWDWNARYHHFQTSDITNGNLDIRFMHLPEEKKCKQTNKSNLICHNFKYR